MRAGAVEIIPKKGGERKQLEPLSCFQELPGRRGALIAYGKAGTMPVAITFVKKDGKDDKKVRVSVVGV